MSDKFYLQYIKVLLTRHCTVKPAFNAEVNNKLTKTGVLFENQQFITVPR